MKTQHFFLGLLLLMSLWIVYHTEQTDLEIYTTEDIYYVRGLNITSESGENNIRFKSKSELKNFISIITAEDANTCQELVYKLEKI